mmetsp:Transcript_60718/g.161318  ORF Transcript_60718/g.161318 Transcript_60718/m.161318 type:complete len:269 (-) Transcript_60718:189-995(-)
MSTPWLSRNSTMAQCPLNEACQSVVAPLLAQTWISARSSMRNCTLGIHPRMTGIVTQGPRHRILLKPAMKEYSESGSAPDCTSNCMSGSFSRIVATAKGVAPMYALYSSTKLSNSTLGPSRLMCSIMSSMETVDLNKASKKCFLLGMPHSFPSLSDMALSTSRSKPSTLLPLCTSTRLERSESFGISKQTWVWCGNISSATGGECAISVSRINWKVISSSRVMHMRAVVNKSSTVAAHSTWSSGSLLWSSAGTSSHERRVRHVVKLRA